MKHFEKLTVGGFVMDTTVIDEINAQIKQVASFAAKSGGENYISSGCEDNGNGTRTGGWIVYQGEPLAIQAGVEQETVSILEQKETINYASGDDEDYTVNRYAVFGNHTNAVVTFNFSTLKPSYAKFADSFLKGCLIPFTGQLSEIPRGFQIADGTNNTPNAGGRVFRSIGEGEGQSEIGKIGGADYIKLLETQLPAHKHNVSISSSGEHDHYMFAEGGSGAQINKLTDYYSGKVASAGDRSGDYKYAMVKADGVGNGEVNQGKTARSGNHNHNISESSVGAGGQIDIRNPYIKGAYITWVGIQ